MILNVVVTGTESCPDCAVEAGMPHIEGCDVARCPFTGWQQLGCGHERHGVPSIWTGEWPGSVECREYGLMFTPVGELTMPDLNALALAALRGEFTWDRDRQRWVRAVFRTIRTGSGGQATYYASRATRDMAAELDAERDGATVITESWSAERDDPANQGWGADGFVEPPGGERS